MKMSPAMKKAQENMQPGVITADGFLGDEKHILRDIIMRDASEMREYELDFEETASVLRHLVEEGRKGLGEPVTVDGKWLVQTWEARGHLACPFEDGIFRKITAEIENKNNHEKILVSDLAIHLMETHQFLEGIGSSFRLDPEKVKAVLKE